jgi:hypothetical protein
MQRQVSRSLLGLALLNWAVGIAGFVEAIADAQFYFGLLFGAVGATAAEVRRTFDGLFGVSYIPLKLTALLLAAFQVVLGNAYASGRAWRRAGFVAAGLSVLQGVAVLACRQAGHFALFDAWTPCVREVVLIGYGVAQTAALLGPVAPADQGEGLADTPGPPPSGPKG